MTKKVSLICNFIANTEKICFVKIKRIIRVKIKRIVRYIKDVKLLYKSNDYNEQKKKNLSKLFHFNQFRMERKPSK